MIYIVESIGVPNHLNHFEYQSVWKVASSATGKALKARRKLGSILVRSLKLPNTCSNENCGILQKATNTCMRMYVYTYQRHRVYAREQTENKLFYACTY